jgi:hypothetical protein
MSVTLHLPSHNALRRDSHNRLLFIILGVPSTINEVFLKAAGIDGCRSDSMLPI